MELWRERAQILLSHRIKHGHTDTLYRHKAQD